MSSGASPRRAAHARLQAFRVVVLVLTGAFFVVPLLSMLDFSTRVFTGGGPNGAAWGLLVTDPLLRGAIGTSLLLSLLTVVGMLVLLVPTMTWVHLRVPAVRRVVEFICLLPLTIPAIVLVVGVAPIYAWVTYLVGDSPLTLTFVYVVLVLPYAYRAIDAALSGVDVVTLAEAARSLGAGWVTVIVRVVVPNIVSGLLAAAFISVALVLGEFTIASLTNYENLQVVINLLGKSEPRTSVAASLAALLFASLLLIVLSFVGRAPRSRREDT